MGRYVREHVGGVVVLAAFLLLVAYGLAAGFAGEDCVPTGGFPC